MEQRQVRPMRDRTLWFGVGAGVIVWALHFFAIYVLVDQVCRGNWQVNAQVVSLVLTVIGVAIVALATLLSFRSWRKLRADGEAYDAAHERYRFMSFSGAVLGVTFIALMILTFVPTFVVPTCR
ncbi:MAG: hypothetical protein IAE80_19705 [Anaerolinea sp.]|nr:hypothetical protein [Anaerolinea sp.]